MKKFLDGFKNWFFGRMPEGKISVGGQAVMEGVMMKGPEHTAIAVRKENGKIVYRVKPVKPLAKKYPVLGFPIIRGVVNFVVMLVSGMKTLTESAEMAGLDVEEPSEFEKKVAKALHMKPDDVMMLLAVILAVVLAIGLFFLIPTAIESFMKRYISSNALRTVLGGVLRIVMFLLYILFCSRLKEIRRVFQYHGAEHKAVFCFESGQDLTVENAQKFSTLHPRCGTSFLMIVMVISILVFLLIGGDTTNVFLRLGRRLLLLPLVAGISYEVLRWLGMADDHPIIRALKWPGLMVQRLTTAQPDDQMVEVALVSLKAALGMEVVLPEEAEKPEAVAQDEIPDPAIADVQA